MDIVSSSPIVQVQFSLDGTPQDFSISENNCPPLDPAVSHHDHGELPEMKSSGPLATLVSALQEAKVACDILLTAAISAASEAQIKSPEKKPRLCQDTDDV